MRANGKFWVAKGPSEMVAEGEFHGVNMGHREERVGGWRQREDNCGMRIVN